MKVLVLLALGAMTIGASSAAQAHHGCGPGYHRTPIDRCIMNGHHKHMDAYGYYPTHHSWNYGHKYHHYHHWAYRPNH